MSSRITSGGDCATRVEARLAAVQRSPPYSPRRAARPPGRRARPLRRRRSGCSIMIHAAGSSTVNVVPVGCAALTSMLPPCSTMMPPHDRQAQPAAPALGRVVRHEEFVTVRGGTPGPLSLTISRTRLLRGMRASVITHDDRPLATGRGGAEGPPSASIALSTRLMMTCRICSHRDGRAAATWRTASRYAGSPAEGRPRTARACPRPAGSDRSPPCAGPRNRANCANSSTSPLSASTSAMMASVHSPTSATVGGAAPEKCRRSRSALS